MKPFRLSGAPILAFIKAIVDTITSIGDLIKMIGKLIWYNISGQFITGFIKLISRIRKLSKKKNITPEAAKKELMKTKTKIKAIQNSL